MLRAVFTFPLTTPSFVSIRLRRSAVQSVGARVFGLMRCLVALAALALAGLGLVAAQALGAVESGSRRCRRVTAPSVPAPTVPVPTVPVPTVSAPSRPCADDPVRRAPTVPAPTFPAPVPAPTVPAPTVPVPAPTPPRPVPSVPSTPPAGRRNDADAGHVVWSGARRLAPLRRLSTGAAAGPQSRSRAAAPASRASTRRVHGRAHVRITFSLPRPQTIELTLRGPAPSCRPAGTMRIRGVRGVNRFDFLGRIGRRSIGPGCLHPVAHAWFVTRARLDSRCSCRSSRRGARFSSETGGRARAACDGCAGARLPQPARSASLRASRSYRRSRHLRRYGRSPEQPSRRLRRRLCRAPNGATWLGVEASIIPALPSAGRRAPWAFAAARAADRSAARR